MAYRHLAIALECLSIYCIRLLHKATSMHLLFNAKTNIYMHEQKDEIYIRSNQPGKVNRSNLK